MDQDALARVISAQTVIPLGIIIVGIFDVIMNVMGGIVGYVIIKNYQTGRMKL